MSKSIKLEDQVYDRLEAFRDKKETFSQAVERLLELPRRITELANIMEGKITHQEDTIARLEEKAATH